MNKLHYLRKIRKISTHDLHKYTGICASTITYLEKEERPFRQIHLDKLTSFFNVTSDYLLGRNDNGLYVFFENEDNPTLITEAEYLKLQQNIDETIIKRVPISFTMGGGKEEISINETPYVIHREIKGKLVDYDLKESLNSKIIALTKKMATDELDKTIKFIEDYIIKN